MGAATDSWLVIAALATTAGYGIYLAGLARHLVQPSRASWLIWSAATAVEAATYAAVNPTAPQRWIFALATIACLVIALALWRRSRWRAPTTSEALCMAACLTAILAWLVFHAAFWAHLMVVAAVPVSFVPTWQSVRIDRTHERSPAWGLWTIGDLATLLVASHADRASVGELGYILVELACHASVWLLIGLPTIFPWRARRAGDGRLTVVDRYAAADELFTVRDNHLGKGVYAVGGFRRGATIVRFAGKRVAAAKLPGRLSGEDDRFVQVERGHYMGPSGSIDDLINHSCAPNAGLRFLASGVFLVALRDIAPGEEIAWDYSTTLADPAWQMPCRCGAASCRGTIGAFATLPADRQQWYRARNLIAPYLRSLGREERAA